METTLPEMSANFIVTQMSFSPSECTSHFGIEPSEVITKGQINPRGGRPAPASSWSLETKWQGFDNTDEVLKLLLDSVWPRRRQIRDFVRKNELKVTIVLKIRGGLGKRNFLRQFSAPTVKKIAYFNSPIYVDPY